MIQKKCLNKKNLENKIKNHKDILNNKANLIKVVIDSCLSSLYYQE